MACKITRAYYKQTSPPPNRSIAITEGFELKSGCVTDDVESRAFDEAGSSSGIKKARRIIKSTAIYCEAEISHLAAWHRTEIRIKCGNGDWTDWVTVQK